MLTDRLLFCFQKIHFFWINSSRKLKQTKCYNEHQNSSDHDDDDLHHHYYDDLLMETNSKIITIALANIKNS